MGPEGPEGPEFLFQKHCGFALNLQKDRLEHCFMTGSLLHEFHLVAEPGTKSLNLVYNKASQPQDLKVVF